MLEKGIVGVLNFIKRNYTTGVIGGGGIPFSWCGVGLFYLVGYGTTLFNSMVFGNCNNILWCEIDIFNSMGFAMRLFNLVGFTIRLFNTVEPLY